VFDHELIGRSDEAAGADKLCARKLLRTFLSESQPTVCSRHYFVSELGKEEMGMGRRSRGNPSKRVNDEINPNFLATMQ